MNELIEDLKNMESKTIRTDWVLARLELIKRELERHVDWFGYHNKNFNKDQDYHMMMIYDTLNSSSFEEKENEPIKVR